MPIQLKRVYDQPDAADGQRILVDRLWPRGLTKEAAQINLWLKAIAPSTALRQAFHQHLMPWPEFEQRYRQELANNPETVATLRALDHEAITLVYGAKDPEHNHAQVLKAFLQSPAR